MIMSISAITMHKQSTGNTVSLKPNGGDIEATAEYTMPSKSGDEIRNLTF